MSTNIDGLVDIRQCYDHENVYEVKNLRNNFVDAMMTQNFKY